MCPELPCCWRRGAVTRRTSELITLLLLPLSILMVCYALFVYHFRSKFLRKKQVRTPGGGPDHVEPPALCLHVCKPNHAGAVMPPI